jgi:propanediol dehydratase small subunit
LKTPSDYPLADKHHESLKTPSGTAFDEIALDALMNGRIRMEDLRVTAEALEMQAEIAESVGRVQLGANLRRAAELVRVPEKEIIEIYNALRPGRADRARLYRLADSLEQRYAAPRCAALIREAAAAYG